MLKVGDRVTCIKDIYKGYQEIPVNRPRVGEEFKVARVIVKEVETKKGMVIEGEFIQFDVDGIEDYWWHSDQFRKIVDFAQDILNNIEIEIDKENEDS